MAGSSHVAQRVARRLENVASAALTLIYFQVADSLHSTPGRVDVVRFMSQNKLIDFEKKMYMAFEKKQ